MYATNLLALGTLMAHKVVYLEDIGFSPFVAAMTMGLIPGMSIFGRMGFGLLGIRFEVRNLAIISCIVQVMALIILSTSKSLPLIYAYAVLFGTSYGALVVALPTFIGAYYGPANYAQILGFIHTLPIVAMAVGPILAGSLYVTTGTYTPAFAIITGFSLVGLVYAILANPPKNT